MITNIAITLMILGSDMDTFVLKVLTNISAVGIVKEEFLSNFPGFVF